MSSELTTAPFWVAASPKSAGLLKKDKFTCP